MMYSDVHVMMCNDVHGPNFTQKGIVRFIWCTFLSSEGQWATSQTCQFRQGIKIYLWNVMWASFVLKVTSSGCSKPAAFNSEQWISLLRERYTKLSLLTNLSEVSSLSSTNQTYSYIPIYTFVFISCFNPFEWNWIKMWNSLQKLYLKYIPACCRKFWDFIEYDYWYCIQQRADWE